MSLKKQKYTTWIETSSGKSGVDYQRSAQITWWSILQGVAVGELIIQVPDVIEKVVGEAQWFLLIYFLVSFLIIVNVWVQMAWAILISRWEINITHTLIILVLGISVSIVCIFVDEPKYWYPAISVLIVSTISVYIYNIKNRTQIGLSMEKVKKIIILYFIFLGISIGASAHVIFSSSITPQIIWGLIFLMATILSLKVQQIQMAYERQLRQVP